MSSSFKEYLIKQGKTKSTVKHYGTYLLDFLVFLDKDHTEAENATSKEVMAYLGVLQKRGLQNKTRSIRLGVIRSFFNYQIQNGLRINNPVSHIKIRGANQMKLHFILSPKELLELYDGYEVPKGDDRRKNRNWFLSFCLSRKRNKAILSLMIHQGLTTPEVGRLKVNDLHLKEGTIFIEGSRRSEPRTLELKSSQIMILMEYQYTTRKELLEYQTQPSDRLFLPTPTASKKMASSSTLQIWKGLTKELKENNPLFINFKQVRASVITHLLKQHNLREVQYMAGHRFVSSTESYMINNTDDLQADINKYHPF